MIKHWLKYLPILPLVALLGCGDDEPDLAPIEERVATAISNLEQELTAPANGWRVNYKPTEESGTFLILMDFDENGEVVIQSDVPDNDGEFLNQTITYRIDNSLGLELILETYGVFHFLFELEDTQFGAEFEFLYQGKVDDNLIFGSKTDIINPTILTFEPAQASDPALFSAELAANLNMFDGLGPQVFEVGPTSQHVMLNDQDISVFWSLDLDQRRIDVEFAAEGTVLDDILSGNNQISLVDHQTSYTLRDGKMVFEEPFSFVINNFLYEFEEMTFGDFENTGPSICVFGEDNNPIFRGQSNIFGDVVIQNTAISASGLGFTSNVYTVNSDFIFDSELDRLSDEGNLLDTTFPDAIGFAFLYGREVNDPTIPIFSAGVILEEGEIYLRSFEPTSTGINRVQIQFTDEYFFRTVPEDAPVPAGVQENLDLLLAELFEGGEVYAYELPVIGFQLFTLLNPCNQIEIFLVN